MSEESESHVQYFLHNISVVVTGKRQRSNITYLLFFLVIGMVSLLQHLSQGADVKLNTTVTQVDRQSSSNNNNNDTGVWRIKTNEEGQRQQTYEFDFLVIATAPAEAAALLRNVHPEFASVRIFSVYFLCLFRCLN